MVWLEINIRKVIDHGFHRLNKITENTIIIKKEQQNMLVFTKIKLTVTLQA